MYYPDYRKLGVFAAFALCATVMWQLLPDHSWKANAGNLTAEMIGACVTFVVVELVLNEKQRESVYGAIGDLLQEPASNAVTYVQNSFVFVGYRFDEDMIHARDRSDSLRRYTKRMRVALAALRPHLEPRQAQAFGLLIAGLTDYHAALTDTNDDPRNVITRLIESYEDVLEGFKGVSTRMPYNYTRSDYFRSGEERLKAIKDRLKNDKIVWPSAGVPR